MKTLNLVAALAVSTIFLIVVLPPSPASAQSTLTSFSGDKAPSCTLDAGTPSQCDMTITRGAKCVTSLEGADAGTAAMGTAVSYPLQSDGGTSTVLRVTSADSANAVVRALCNK